MNLFVGFKIIIWIKYTVFGGSTKVIKSLYTWIIIWVDTFTNHNDIRTMSLMYEYSCMGKILEHLLIEGRLNPMLD